MHESLPLHLGERERDEAKPSPWEGTSTPVWAGAGSLERWLICAGLAAGLH